METQEANEAEGSKEPSKVEWEHGPHYTPPLEEFTAQNEEEDASEDVVEEPADDEEPSGEEEEGGEEEEEDKGEDEDSADPATARRFAAISKRESAAQKLMREAKDRQKTIDEQEAKFKALEELAKSNPEAFAEKIGFDINRWTEQVLQDGKLPDDKSKLPKEAQERLDKLEKELNDRKAQEAAKERDSRMKAFKSNIATEIESKKEDAQFVSATEQSDDVVFSYVHSYYRENGSHLPLDQAVEIMENSLTEQFTAYLATEKGKKLAREVLGEKEPATPPSEPKQKGKSKTLKSRGQGATMPASKVKVGEWTPEIEEKSIEALAQKLVFTDD